MSTKRIEYHEGAASDVKIAVAWYQKRSAKAALDFIEELHRAHPALETPFRHNLLGTRIRDHGLGCRSRQPTAGVPDKEPLASDQSTSSHLRD